MEIIIITAMTKKGIIGKDNTLPWKIEEELHKFKRLTEGNTVIMGKNTFDSIKFPLIKRHNIIISKSLKSIKGVEICKSINEAIKKAKKYKKNIFIIGGASIYQQTINLADKMYISYIKKDYEGNIFFPKFNKNQWKLEYKKDFNEFEFMVYKNIKKEIRNKIIKKRISLCKEDVLFKSNFILKNLFKIDMMQKAQKIGIYFSIDNEVSTKKIIKYLLSQKKEIFLPKINGNNLEFKKIEGFKDIKKGKFKIQEPKINCQKIELKDLDLLIVPCVAVDEKGNRIGRGGGFYDKAINNKINTICLAYEFQVLNKICADKYDKKVDIIITEKRIINAKKYMILDGKKLADKIIKQLKNKIKIKEIKANLSVILIGNNPASEIYVKKKEEKCREAGIDFNLIKFKSNILESKIISKIKSLNKDKKINGILVQLPLPSNINLSKVINSINPKKDVDGLTEINKEKLKKGDEKLAPPTAKGILKLLEEYKMNLNNKKFALVGFGKLVGYPLSLMLKNRKLDFEVYDINTKNIKEKTKKADIIITATGVPNLIKKDWVKKGSVIIDAGTSKKNGKIVGDVDFNSVKEKVSYITPVPGGVGPMTIVMLIENIIETYT